jgi:hypothetical protein
MANGGIGVWPGSDENDPLAPPSASRGGRKVPSLWDDEPAPKPTGATGRRVPSLYDDEPAEPIQPPAPVARTPSPAPGTGRKIPSFYDAQEPKPHAPAQPEEKPTLADDLKLGGKALAKGLYKAATDIVPQTVGGAIEGFDVPLRDEGRISRMIADQGRDMEAKGLTPEERERKVLGVKAGTLESGAESTGYSAAILGPQYLAQRGAAALGTLASPGVGTAAGLAAGAVVGYAIASRADMNQVLRQKRDQLLEVNPDMTETEWASVKEQVRSAVQKHGQAEGGWEAAGNALQLAIMGLGAKWGVGRPIIQKIAGIATSAVADVPLEIATEAKTQQAQAAAEREIGLREPGSPLTFMEAVGEVGPQTIVTTLLTMGMGGAVAQTGKAIEHRQFVRNKPDMVQGMASIGIRPEIVDRLNKAQTYDAWKAAVNASRTDIQADAALATQFAGYTDEQAAELLGGLLAKHPEYRGVQALGSEDPRDTIRALVETQRGLAPGSLRAESPQDRAGAAGEAGRPEAGPGVQTPAGRPAGAERSPYDVNPAAGLREGYGSPEDRETEQAINDIADGILARMENEAGGAPAAAPAAPAAPEVRNQESEVRIADQPRAETVPGAAQPAEPAAVPADTTARIQEPADAQAARGPTAEPSSIEADLSPVPPAPPPQRPNAATVRKMTRKQAIALAEQEGVKGPNAGLVDPWTGYTAKDVQDRILKARKAAESPALEKARAAGTEPEKGSGERGEGRGAEQPEGVSPRNTRISRKGKEPKAVRPEIGSTVRFRGEDFTVVGHNKAADHLVDIQPVAGGKVQTFDSGALEQMPKGEEQPEGGSTQKAQGAQAEKPPELMTPNERGVNLDPTKAGGISKFQHIMAEIRPALESRKPVNAEAIDAYRYADKLPSGYIRDGDRYVFKGPQQAPESAPRAEPAAETPKPPPSAQAVRGDEAGESRPAASPPIVNGGASSQKKTVVYKFTSKKAAQAWANKTGVSGTLEKSEKVFGEAQMFYLEVDADAANGKEAPGGWYLDVNSNPVWLTQDSKEIGFGPRGPYEWEYVQPETGESQRDVLKAQMASENEEYVRTAQTHPLSKSLPKPISAVLSGATAPQQEPSDAQAARGPAAGPLRKGQAVRYKGEDYFVSGMPRLLKKQGIVEITRKGGSTPKAVKADKLEVVGDGSAVQGSRFTVEQPKEKETGNEPGQSDSARQGTPEIVPQGQGRGQDVPQPRNLPGVPQGATVQAAEAGAGGVAAEKAAAEPVVERTLTDAVVTVPMSAKAEKSITMKEQKAFLLAEIDKAIEAAPRSTQDEQNFPRTVRIEVPNDGVFTIPNGRKELEYAKKVMKSRFPTSVPKYVVPGATLGAEDIGRDADAALDLYKEAGAAAKKIREQIAIQQGNQAIDEKQQARMEALAAELESRAYKTSKPVDQRTAAQKSVDAQIERGTYPSAFSKAARDGNEREARAIEAMRLHPLYAKLREALSAVATEQSWNEEARKRRERGDLLNVNVYGRGAPAVLKLQKAIAKDLGIAKTDVGYNLRKFFKDYAKEFEPTAETPVETEAETTVSVETLREEAKAAGVSPIGTKADLEKRLAATPKPAAKPESAEIESGEELKYNRRNRVSRRNWSDFEGLNPALKAREVQKNNVWPAPDYQAMIDGGTDLIPTDVKDARIALAHIAKQVRDAVAVQPNVRGVPTDEDFKRYVEGVQRIEKGLAAWLANEDGAKGWMTGQGRAAGAMLGAMRGQPTEIGRFAYRGPQKSLLDYVYPDGWRNHRDEVIALGGNRLLQKLQPGQDELARAIKDIGNGWPTKREAWQVQGYRVAEAPLRIEESQSQYEPGKTLTALYAGSEYVGLLRPEAIGAAREKVAKALPFSLYRKRTYVDSFATEAEAIEAAREASKREKGQQKDVEGTNVGQAERIGAARRLEGENVDAEKLMATIGLRGVNFGNWMKGPSDRAEAQAHLNHAHDALLDLAELLNVPAKAVSMDGMLGLAIGAQGSGKHAAHFMPGMNEINITRTRGSGALAHEWAHAFDHYFGRLAGFEASDAPFLTEHAKTGVPGVRPEIAAAFKTIVTAMQRKPMSPEYAAKLAADRLGRDQKAVESFLAAIRSNDFRDQEAEFDRLADRVKNGDFGDGQIMAGNTAFSPVVDEMRQLYKAKHGRLPAMQNYRGLQAWLSSIIYERSHQDAAASHVPQTETTDYLKQANALQKDKGGRLYWNTPREMFARAFDAYVSDKLAERAAKNSYLAGLEIAAPKGEERKAINAAFDVLVRELKTRETERGVEMYAGADVPEPVRKYESAMALRPVVVAGRTLSRVEAEASYRKIGTVENADGGDAIRFVMAAFNKIARHRQRDMLFRIVPNLKEIARDAVKIYEEAERDPLRHGNISAYGNYLHRVEIDGEPYFVRLTAQILKDGRNELHNVFVSDVDLIKADQNGDIPGVIRTASNPVLIGSDKKLLDWIQSVKRLKDGLDGQSERYAAAGINAATADNGQHQEAERMEKAGETREAIWRKTGWWKGPDGKWRFEIDDSKMRMKIASASEIADRSQANDPQKTYADMGVSDGVQLSEVIDHPDLFKAYPELKGVVVYPTRNANAGQYSNGVKSIGWSTRIFGSAAKSTLVHEIQHYIQNAENFETGSSIDGERKAMDAELDRGRMDALSQMVKFRKTIPDVVDSFLQMDDLDKDLAGKYGIDLVRMDGSIDQTQYGRLRDSLSPEDARRKQEAQGAYYEAIERAGGWNTPAVLDFLNSASRLWKANIAQVGDSETAYRLKGGEVEARFIERRLDLTPFQRKAVPPWVTMEKMLREEGLLAQGQKPEDALIFRKGLAGAPAESRMEAGYGSEYADDFPAADAAVEGRRDVRPPEDGGGMGGAVGIRREAAERLADAKRAARDSTVADAELDDEPGEAFAGLSARMAQRGIHLVPVREGTMEHGGVSINQTILIPVGSVPAAILPGRVAHEATHVLDRRGDEDVVRAETMVNPDHPTTKKALAALREVYLPGFLGLAKKRGMAPGPARLWARSRVDAYVRKYGRSEIVAYLSEQMVNGRNTLGDFDLREVFGIRRAPAEAAVGRYLDRMGFGKDAQGGARGEGRGARGAAEGRGARGVVDGRLAAASATASKSATATDREYLAAVERGDMGAAQRIVDEAAKRAGYTVGPLMHGTPDKKGFTQFNFDKSGQQGEWGAVFFTDNEKLADRFSHEQIESERSKYFVKLGEKGRIVRGYLKMDNPLDLRSVDEEKAKILQRISEDDRSYKWPIEGILRDAKAPNKSLIKTYLPNTNLRKLADYGYDGYIAAISEIDGGGTEYAVISSAQIKSADPIVRDDAGRIIPPSERFNPKNDDIRFAAPDPSPKPSQGEWDGAEVKEYDKKDGTGKGWKIVWPDGSTIQSGIHSREAADYILVERMARVGRRGRRSRKIRIWIPKRS